MSEPAAAGARPGSGGFPQWLRVAIGGGGGMFVSMGLGRFSYTAMVPALISSGELTALEAGRVGALNLAGFVIGAIMSVAVGARFGAYRALVCAGLLSALALTASAVPLGFAWLALWRALIGLAAGVIMVLSLSLVAATAPARWRTVAASFVFAGVGMAILLAGILVPILLANGLRAAWLGLAAFGLVAMALAIWGWSSAPTASAPARTVEAGSDESPWTWPLRLLLAGYFFFSFALVPHSLYWVDYIARGLGLGMSRGGFHWGLVGIASMIGPWILAAIGLRLATAVSLPVTYIFVGLGIGAPLLSTAEPVLIASSVLFGAQPGLATLMAARVRDLASAENMPRLMRAMVLASAIGSLVAGAVLPQLYEITHSHVLLFAVGGASMIIGGLLVIPWRGRR